MCVFYNNELPQMLPKVTSLRRYGGQDGTPGEPVVKFQSQPDSSRCPPKS